MSGALKGLFALLFLAYPFLIYFGLGFLSWRGLSLLILVLGIARVAGIFAGGGPTLFQAPLKRHMIFAAFALIVVAAASAAFESSQALLYYPVIVNGLLLVLFATSLFRPPSVIERLARLSEPDLSPEGQRYTRKVTMVWCVFFPLNGAASLYTVLAGDMALWALYNGFIAYLLMGGLFAVEYAVRHWVRRRGRRRQALS